METYLQQKLRVLHSRGSFLQNIVNGDMFATEIASLTLARDFSPEYSQWRHICKRNCESYTREEFSPKFNQWRHFCNRNCERFSPNQEGSFLIWCIDGRGPPVFSKTLDVISKLLRLGLALRPQRNLQCFWLILNILMATGSPTNSI